jgi:hypothetical protein
MMGHWRTTRAASGEQPQPGPHHDADTRAVFEWLDKNPSALEPTLPYSQFTQTLFDVATVFVWLFLFACGVFVVGGPFLVLLWMILFS